MFSIVYKNKLHYASYVFMKKAIARGETLNSKRADKVLDIIHPSVFIHDTELDKFITKKTVLDFPVALRRFFLNDFKTAKKKLLRIKKTSPSYIESNYILGLIHLRENKKKSASKYFSRCVRYASRRKKSEIKSAAYIASFKNRCVQQIARVKFSGKKFKKSIKLLNTVKKTDYIWPRLILDKAWSYYWNKENARALGSVVSFKAPLLQRFMIPEANYLRALIYYEMCYFEKSESIYKEFAKTTWKLRKYAKDASRNKLLNLIRMKEEPKNPGDKFLYFYLKGYKKDIRYFTYEKARAQLAIEIKKLAKIKSMKQARVFLNSLIFYYRAIKEDFKDFLKNVADDYYLQIRQMRNAFVKLNLMISLKKRKNINSKTKEDESFEDLDLEEISNTEDKYIWNFLGGFWADEIGDYAVALKNRCEK